MVYRFWYGKPLRHFLPSETSCDDWMHQVHKLCKRYVDRPEPTAMFTACASNHTLGHLYLRGLS